jgi:Domain of unknown function (DUF5047)
MYPVSAEFRSIVSSGAQRPIVKAEVLFSGSSVTDLTLQPGGSVTIDNTREGSVRSLSLTCAPDADAWRWLTTLGAEIKVWRGFVLSDGTEELVPLGVFVIDSDIVEDERGSIPISAADRAARISRNRWADPYVVPSGTDLGEAIVSILLSRWAQCPTSIETTGVTLDVQSVFQIGADSDPWKDARGLATAMGYDLYFDGDGIAALRPIPDLNTTQPCMTYYSGDLCIVLGRKRGAAMSAVYTGVIASGEGSGVDTPVQAKVWDEDPASPTYHYGPLGEIPYFYSSPLLTTATQCELAGTTLLQKVRGKTEQMSWTLVANPAHDAYDVVSLVDVESSAEDRYILDVLKIPLDNTTMSATARATVLSS